MQTEKPAIKIPLSRGLFALVDASDYARISHFNWYAWGSVKGPHLIYAIRAIRLASGRCSKRSMHREIMGAKKGDIIDHRNRDGLDNRRQNLRFCPQSQNLGNSRQHKNAGSSRFKGVSWHRGTGKWEAKIRFQKKRHYLGLFDREEQAAAVYANAAKKFFGEFSRTA